MQRPKAVKPWGSSPARPSYSTIKPKGYYGKIHQQLREILLSQSPFCERCRVNFSSEAHHKHPGKIAYSIEDYEALCSECHREQHR